MCTYVLIYPCNLIYIYFKKILQGLRRGSCWSMPVYSYFEKNADLCPVIQRFYTFYIFSPQTQIHRHAVILMCRHAMGGFAKANVQSTLKKNCQIGHFALIWLNFITSACMYIYIAPLLPQQSWWRHQMETFSALLAICAGNSQVPVNSPHKGQWRGALIYSLWSEPE